MYMYKSFNVYLMVILFSKLYLRIFESIIEFGETEILGQLLEQDFDEYSTCRCCVIFIEFNDLQNLKQKSLL